MGGLNRLGSFGSIAAAMAAVLVVLLATRPAFAQAPGGETGDQAADTPEGVAARAADVHAQNCSAVETGSATSAAVAVGEVGPLLADVARAYEETEAVYLLYWRGLLNACLDQDERAAADLTEFLATGDDDPQLFSLVRDARRRLARLPGGAGGGTSDPVPGAIAGLSLLGGAGVIGGLSAWQGQVTATRQADFREGKRDWAATEEILGELRAAADASNALLAGTIAVGVAGVVTLVATGASGSNSGPTAAILVVPDSRGGLSLTVAGTW